MQCTVYTVANEAFGDVMEDAWWDVGGLRMTDTDILGKFAAFQVFGIPVEWMLVGVIKLLFCELA